MVWWETGSAVKKAQRESHRAGRLAVAPAAVDAADLRLRTGQRETLEVRPGRQERARITPGHTNTEFTGFDERFKGPI